MLKTTLIRSAATLLLVSSCITAPCLLSTQALAAPEATASAPADGEKNVTASAKDKVATSQPSVADGLSEEDAAAVAEGNTVRCIDQYFSNLKDAVELANQNGGGTIAILADTAATDDPAEVATIGFRTSIMIKSEGDTPLRIYRAEGQTGAMLTITDGTVNIKNVTIDGSGTNATAPAVMISDQAVVTFGKNLTIEGISADGSGVAENFAASAVSVSGSDAYLTLKKGSVISNCVATGAAKAAIYNDGANVENKGMSFEGNTTTNGDNPNYAGDGKLTGDKI